MSVLRRLADIRSTQENVANRPLTVIRFSREGLEVSHGTLRRFVEQATRLYEQERHQPTDALGCYVRRWLGWAGGGLNDKQKPRHGAGLIDNLLPIDLLLSSLSPSPTHTR